ncbi:DUF5602 domain-containing protein [Salinigranum salinum]|uniref:DUF5602 domain-containing protein n=1 Tax=Salinigranum salinum TaxID=1364937 RepID=UPI0012605E0B|nr:DUF5602 domain-containing protein [Salinigranum salinum]
MNTTSESGVTTMTTTDAPRIGRRTVLQAAGAIAASGLLAGRARAAHRDDGTFTAWGRPVEVASGVDVRTFATLDRRGVPVAIGVHIPVEAMRVLPAKLTAYHLDFPRALTTRDTHAFTFAGLDWNPAGHPGPMYEVPHFDVHFYLMDEAEVEAIAPGVAAYEIAAERLPEGYVFEPVRFIVPEMGEHLVDPTSPEFNGQPFTETFIYGAYARDGASDDSGVFGAGATGEITFLEPMVTKAFLETNPSVRKSIKQPQGFAVAGYYPTTYTIEYRSQWQAYVVTLEDFEWVDAV